MFSWLQPSTSTSACGAVAVLRALEIMTFPALAAMGPCAVSSPEHPGIRASGRLLLGILHDVVSSRRAALPVVPGTRTAAHPKSSSLICNWPQRAGAFLSICDDDRMCILGHRVSSRKATEAQVVGQELAAASAGGTDSGSLVGQASGHMM